MTLEPPGEELLADFAGVLAHRDRREGGTRHSIWGLEMQVWALAVRRVHGACGHLDTSLMEAFRDRVIDAPAVICPKHGRLDGPQIPPPIGHEGSLVPAVDPPPTQPPQAATADG